MSPQAEAGLLWPTRPQTRRLLLSVLLAAAAAVVLAFYARQCVRRGNDFRTMWTAWGFALRGEDIYTKVDMKDATPAKWRNPPFFVASTCLFGLLDVRTAAYAWFLFKLALIAACLWRLDRVRRRLAPDKPWITWGPLLLSLFFLNFDFTIGHMNIVAAALVILALVSFAEERWAQAAVFGSLAAVVKGPALLLPAFYAAKKRFRLAAASALLVGVWTAAPALLWGPAKTIAYTKDFSRSVNFDVIFSDIENGWAENWGLPELIMRVTGQTHPESRYGRTLELVRLPYEVSKALTLAVTGACVLALLAFWWTRAGRSAAGFRGPALQDAALAATSVLLFSPVTRKAYFGALLLPYFALWGYVSTVSLARRRRVLPLFCLSVGLAYLNAADLFGKRLAFFFESWHVLSFSLLTLFAAQLLAALG